MGYVGILTAVWAFLGLDDKSASTYYVFDCTYCVLRNSLSAAIPQTAQCSTLFANKIIPP